VKGYHKLLRYLLFVGLALPVPFSIYVIIELAGASLNGRIFSYMFFLNSIPFILFYILGRLALSSSAMQYRDTFIRNSVAVSLSYLALVVTNLHIFLSVFTSKSSTAVIGFFYLPIEGSIVLVVSFVVVLAVMDTFLRYKMRSAQKPDSSKKKTDK